MKRILTLTTLVLGLISGGSEASGAQWVGTASPHFVIYVTEHTDSASEQVLEKLETARRFFERTGLAQNDLKSVDIVAFRSEAEYAAYRINPGAYAFYQRTYNSDCVVMRGLEAEHLDVAVHEYTHFVLEHSGYQKLPLWLNEGLADFYSTLEMQQGGALLGASPRGRLTTLERHGWIDWNTLAAVEQQSIYYRQPDKMLAFYAQSWALVRTLAMEQPYAAHFQDFLKFVSKGQPVDASFEAAFGKTIPQAGTDVEELVRSRMLRARDAGVAMSAQSFETHPVENAAENAEFSLAEVLAANVQMADQAESRLADLSARYPANPRADEARGFMALRAGAERDALTHFENAVAKNSQNPEVMLRLAHLRLQDDGSEGKVIGLLQRVLERDATNYAARLELGFAAAKIHNYELAINTLQAMRELHNEHKYVVFYTLAYCLIETSKANEARLYARRAEQAAGNGNDRAQVATLMHYIEQEEPVQVAER